MPSKTSRFIALPPINALETARRRLQRIRLRENFYSGLITISPSPAASAALQRSNNLCSGSDNGSSLSRLAGSKASIAISHIDQPTAINLMPRSHLPHIGCHFTRKDIADLQYHRIVAAYLLHSAMLRPPEGLASQSLVGCYTPQFTELSSKPMGSL